MSNQAEWLLSTCLRALRATPIPGDEAALLVARLAVWHEIQDRLPEDLRPPPNDQPLSPPTLRRVWEALENHLDDPLRHAFSGIDFAPLAFVTESLLTALNVQLTKWILFDADQREQFAKGLLEAWLSERRETPELPSEVAEFCVRIVDVRPKDRVLCAGGSVTAIIAAVHDARGLPVACVARPPALALLYSCLIRAVMELVLADPASMDADIALKGERFDRGIVFPAWGQRYDEFALLRQVSSEFGLRTSEALGLEIAARRVTGALAVLLPSSALWSKGGQRGLREALVRQGRIQGVIALPGGLLRGTPIALNVLALGTSMPARKIRFVAVDATHVTGRGKLRSNDRRLVSANALFDAIAWNDPDTSQWKTIEQLEREDFSLDPNRYLSRPMALLEDGSRETANLGSLVDIIKPQFLASAEGSDGTEIQEASPGDFPEFGYLSAVARTRRVSSKDFRARENQILRDGDVLLSTKGTVGRLAIVKLSGDTVPLLPSQSSVILRARQGGRALDPRYLVQFLRSPMLQMAIRSMAIGVTIPNIPLAELKKLLIWVLPPADEQALVRSFDDSARAERDILELRQRQRAGEQELWERLELASAGQ